MRYLLGILGSFALLFMVMGCGDLGTNTLSDSGDSGLLITASGDLGAEGISSGFSVDCYQKTDEPFSSHMVTADFEVVDLYSQYTDRAQGVTFTYYTIEYSSSVTGAPVLTTKTNYQTIQIALAQQTAASLSTDVELFGLETKDEFATQYNSSPAAEFPVSYDITLTFYGQDWLTGSDITSSFTVNVEAGAFDNGGTAPDVTAPTTPASVTATAGATAGTIGVVWTASTDDTAVTGYYVYRDGTFIASSTAATYSDSGLTTGNTYCYAISAFDAAGNISTQSGQSCAVAP